MKSLLVAGAAALLIAGCMVEDEPPEPLAITVDSGQRLHLVVGCADDVTAHVREFSDRVEIADLDGDTHEQDSCLGSVTLHLEAPLGDREVFVGGEPWSRLPDGCAFGDFGPDEPSAALGCDGPATTTP